MKKNSGKTGVAGDTRQDPRKPLLIIGGRSKKKVAIQIPFLS